MWRSNGNIICGSPDNAGESKSDALGAFWGGLEEPGRSSGGVLAEVMGVLGGLGRFVGVPMPICKKNVRFWTPSWAPCWARKICFLMLKIGKMGFQEALRKK